MTDARLTPPRPDEVRQALRQAAANVLETMFFVSPAGEDEQEGVLRPAAARLARIEFHGGLRGAFTLCVPDSMASVIAANFLARDECDLAPSEAAQVVSEFANMVCGATLSAIAPDTVFDLSPPSLGAGEPRPDCDWLAFDCGLIGIHLEFGPHP